MFISKGAELIPASYTLANIEHCPELMRKKKKRGKASSESTYFYFNIDECMLWFLLGRCVLHY